MFLPFRMIRQKSKGLVTFQTLQRGCSRKGLFNLACLDQQFDNTFPNCRRLLQFPALWR